MSDFDDDEPIEGKPKGGARPPAGGADGPASDDDWDDEPAPRRRRRPAPVAADDDDDWDDDWDDDDERRSPRRDLTLVYVVIAAAVVIVLAVVLTRPKDSTPVASGGDDTEDTKDGGLCENWPGALGGDGSNVSSGEGVYIWSDFNGFHVRSNRPDEVVVEVSAPANIRVTKKGGATTSADAGKVLTVTIPGSEGAAGPDFDVSCEASPVTFEITAAGTPVPAEEIKVGGSSTADANPAIFTRGDP